VLGTEAAEFGPEESKEYDSYIAKCIGHYRYCILSTIAGYKIYIKLSLIVTKENALIRGGKWRKSSTLS
jgi:hypothetical protein